MRAVAVAAVVGGWQLDYLLFVTAGRAREVERLTSSEVFNLGQCNVPKRKTVGKFFRRTQGGVDGLITRPEYF